MSDSSKLVHLSKTQKFKCNFDLEIGRLLSHQAILKDTNELEDLVRDVYSPLLKAKFMAPFVYAGVSEAGDLNEPVM